MSDRQWQIDSEWRANPEKERERERNTYSHLRPLLLWTRERSNEDDCKTPKWTRDVCVYMCMYVCMICIHLFCYFSISSFCILILSLSRFFHFFSVCVCVSLSLCTVLPFVCRIFCVCLSLSPICLYLSIVFVYVFGSLILIINMSLVALSLHPIPYRIWC